MREKGITIVIKKGKGIENNKMISVDKKNGIIGSYNLFKSSQKNDNSLVLFWNMPEHVRFIEEICYKIYYRDIGGKSNEKK